MGSPSAHGSPRLFLGGDRVRPLAAAWAQHDTCHFVAFLVLEARYGLGLPIVIIQHGRGVSGTGRACEYGSMEAPLFVYGVHWDPGEGCP